MEFDFHPVKPRKADFTDDVPGVSMTNTDVKFRDAEITIIHNSDYRIRCFLLLFCSLTEKIIHSVPSVVELCFT